MIKPGKDGRPTVDLVYVMAVGLGLILLAGSMIVAILALIFRM